MWILLRLSIFKTFRLLYSDLHQLLMTYKILYNVKYVIYTVVSLY